MKVGVCALWDYHVMQIIDSIFLISHTTRLTSCIEYHYSSSCSDSEFDSFAFPLPSLSCINVAAWKTPSEAKISCQRKWNPEIRQLDKIWNQLAPRSSDIGTTYKMWTENWVQSSHLTLTSIHQNQTVTYWNSLFCIWCLSEERKLQKDWIFLLT